MSVGLRVYPYICVECKNSIVKSGLKCNICPKIYHRSCASKLKKCCEVEISTLFDMKTEDEDSLKGNISESNMHITANSSDRDLLLKIIHELEDKNRLLEENSQLLKYKISNLENEILKNENRVCSRCDNNSTHNVREKIIKSDKRKVNTDGIGKVASYANVVSTATGLPVPVAKVSVDSALGSPNTSVPQSKFKQNTDKITLSEVNEAMKNVETIINNNKAVNKKSDNNTEWKSVQSRKTKRKNRPALVVGNCTESPTIQGVEKLKALHVSRLNPATSVVDLHNFLSRKFTFVKCETLQSRYPDTYASFKVLIPHGEFDKAKDAANWPKNCSINYFFPSRKRSSDR